MKSFLDFEEKNVEKAVQKACESLNVSREKLKYDIISHGSSGIFGLVGAKKALIRVFVPDLPNGSSSPSHTPSTESDATRPASELAQFDRDTVSALVDEAFGESRSTEATATETPQQKKSRKPRKIQKTEKKAAPDQPAMIEETVKETPDETEEKILTTQTSTESDLSNTPPTPSDFPQPDLPASPTPNSQEAFLSVARELAEKIFTAMEVTAEISLKTDADPVVLSVKVPDPSVLIGKRGQTLEAIQYLLDKVLAKQIGKGSRVIFDVEGYVEARKSELKDLATRLANKTLKSGKPSTMMRMNAHDRRIVHIALKRHPAVRTQSVGDGYYRKLIIFPKKKIHKKSDGPQASE